MQRGATRSIDTAMLASRKHDTARAVFLDRDGVIIRDPGLITAVEQVELMDDAPAAMKLLADGGFVLTVVSNQPVVARGLVSESEVRSVNSHISSLLLDAGGVAPHCFRFCPHHPNATLKRYKLDCLCRKPRPGMLLDLAKELRLDLSRSFMIGDRISDIAAGRRAGCRTVLVETGMHLQAPIQSPDPPEAGLAPDYRCNGLAAAADWILQTDRGPQR